MFKTSFVENLIAWMQDNIAKLVRRGWLHHCILYNVLTFVLFAKIGIIRRVNVFENCSFFFL